MTIFSNFLFCHISMEFLNWIVPIYTISEIFLSTLLAIQVHYSLPSYFHGIPKVCSLKYLFYTFPPLFLCVEYLLQFLIPFSNVSMELPSSLVSQACYSLSLGFPRSIVALSSCLFSQVPYSI